MNKEQLKVILQRKHLQDLTCVRMSLRMIDRESLSDIIARLRVDADKIRMSDTELYNIINA